jgi:uncharacterized protein YndB with AHSA1/START domain/DNA-binding transcriptional ArsR family regulator
MLSGMDDLVFKALNDGSRRLLLDALFVEDGQSLGELSELLPQMTRFGVMNHLSVLGEAGLVTTHRSGRRKLHYLNPVPIQMVHERWITKYTQGKVRTMTQIKSDLESAAINPTPDHIYQVIINVAPDVVWNAIVDGDITEKYFYGTRVESRWEEGAGIRYMHPDGRVASEGTILEIDPGRMVDMTFQALWDDDMIAEGPAREIWRVEDFNGATKLTIELYDTPADSKTYSDFTSGFPYIVSGMKTYLETGESLPSPY